MSDTILSLTTIPSRAAYLGDFLKALERQKVHPNRIELNLPDVYTKRSLGQVDRKLIPNDFDVFECEDVGPATKILPTLKRYENTDNRIVYCDDDRAHHSNWMKRLLETADAHPGSAVSSEINSVTAIDYRYHHPNKTLTYRLKRAASFGFYDPYKASRKTQWDIVEGFGGVLVQPSFFAKSVFDIPESVWMVDDVWLSANLAANGTPIVWTDRPQKERSRSMKVDGVYPGRSVDPLAAAVIENVGRVKSDYDAVAYCQKAFGIWQDRQLT